jgi:hypothetical protein
MGEVLHGIGGPRGSCLVRMCGMRTQVRYRGTGNHSGGFRERHARASFELPVQGWSFLSKMLANLRLRQVAQFRKRLSVRG